MNHWNVTSSAPLNGMRDSERSESTDCCLFEDYSEKIYQRRVTLPRFIFGTLSPRPAHSHGTGATKWGAGAHLCHFYGVS